MGAAGPVPFVHRRISQEHVAASGLALPPNVIRLPRGPDKNTKGFQRWCKSLNLVCTNEDPMPFQSLHLQRKKDLKHHKRRRKKPRLNQWKRRLRCQKKKKSKRYQSPHLPFLE